MKTVDVTWSEKAEEYMLEWIETEAGVRERARIFCSLPW